MDKRLIKIFLHGDSLNNITVVTDDTWNYGLLYSVPREKAKEILKIEECHNVGVYILLSSGSVYIGQALDLAKRINQHLKKRDNWTKAILLTSEKGKLDHSDIDYLESKLIDAFKKSKNVITENKTKGMKQNTNIFSEPRLQRYLHGAMLLLELLGLNNYDITTENYLNKTSQRESFVEKQSKKQAIVFLKNKGYSLSKTITFASLQIKKSSFYWANPLKEVVNKNWNIILNNQIDKKLILLSIPKNDLSVGRKNGLICRKDKSHHNLIDLRLDFDTLVDHASGIDFNKYIVAKINYN